MLLQAVFAAGGALRPGGMITKEFSYIAHQLRMNRTGGDAAGRVCGQKRAGGNQNFSDIFAVSKRSRGELVSVVNHTVHVISDRLQVREEILTMTAEKQFEQKIMNLVPYCIVIYIEFSSPVFPGRCTARLPEEWL